MPRVMRLAEAQDYAHVFERPWRSADQLVVVLGRRNGRSIPRLGLAISRRQVRRAVGRNRLKRLIRESFRAHQQTLQGIDVVVIGRAAASGASNKTLLGSLSRHWDYMSKRCAGS